LVLKYIGVSFKLDFAGMVTGMRGLCNGMGPAMFGVVFYMFHVDLNEGDSSHNATHSTQVFESYTQVSFDKYVICLF